MARAIVKTLPGKIYEDADHSIGQVGLAVSTANFGTLSAADFPGAASLSSFYSLNSAGTDGSANARTFTASGTPGFNGAGFYGNENCLQIISVADKVQRTGDTFFNINLATGAMTFGGWFYLSNWGLQLGTGRVFMSLNPSANGALIEAATAGLRVTNTTGSITVVIPWSQVSSGWHHLVAQVSAGTLKFYFDGQLVGSNTGLTGTGANSDGYIGGDSSGDGVVGCIIQQAFFTNQALTDAQILSLASKRYKGSGQLAGGHALAADSFPLSNLTNKVAFWNFSTDGSDGSGNGKTLTNNNATPFTGLNIFGASSVPRLNGTTQNFSATLNDTFYNYSGTMGCGGWFNADDWQQSSKAMFGMYSSNANSDFLVQLSAGFIVAYGGSLTTSVPVPLSAVGGSWHHVALTYDKTSDVWKLYYDGTVIGSFSSPRPAVSASVTFRFGALGNAASNFWSGRMQDCFFVRDYLLTESDIQKIVASRIDLATSLAPEDQRWLATYISENSLIKSDINGSEFVVDKDNTKVWVDFGGGSSARVNIRMNQA